MLVNPAVHKYYKSINIDSCFSVPGTSERQEAERTLVWDLLVSVSLCHNIAAILTRGITFCV